MGVKAFKQRNAFAVVRNLAEYLSGILPTTGRQMAGWRGTLCGALSLFDEIATTRALLLARRGKNAA